MCDINGSKCQEEKQAGGEGGEMKRDFCNFRVEGGKRNNDKNQTKPNNVLRYDVSRDTSEDASVQFIGNHSGKRFFDSLLEPSLWVDAGPFTGTWLIHPPDSRAV